MTRAEAVAAATAEVAKTGQPVDIWQHVGGQQGPRIVLPQNRFLPRDPLKPPKWGWVRVETITPATPASETPAPVARPTPAQIAEDIAEDLMARGYGRKADKVHWLEAITAAIQAERDAR